MVHQLTSELLHRAVVFAALSHRGHFRKGTDIPYITHPFLVMTILDRLGFDEEVLAAALLHDVLEDTPTTFEELKQQFGERIAQMVQAVSETKTDKHGNHIPWALRKQEKLDKLRNASVEARAIALADLLDNFHMTWLEERQLGPAVWERFNAPRQQRLEHSWQVIAACESDDPRLRQLSEACRDMLGRFSEPASPNP
ncbi:MAG: HD domain-containing protein [Gemmatales bacterium]|nr:HD domain-containing protein [Gemmatales bacterium]MDW8388061.1 HD domain-containing protein [Gemmatales bacterium]